MARMLLFAAAREAAGCREVEITATSLGEALALAVERFGPPFEKLLPYCTMTVDQVAVPSQEVSPTPVSQSSEIGVLPPVSGGSTGVPPARRSGPR